MKEESRLTAAEKNIQSAARRAKYDKYCACILSFPWLSVDFTVLNFYILRNFSLNIDHKHNFKEILYVISGSGAIRIDGARNYALKKGSIVYLDAGVKHRLVREPGRPMRVCVISFTTAPQLSSDKIPPELIEDERQLLGRVESAKYHIAEDSHNCGRILRTVLDAMDTNNPGEFVKIKNSISSLLLGAFQSIAKLPKRPDFDRLLQSSPTFNAMKIIQYMRQHYTEGITLPLVAEALHYSPRQCQRIIYDSMGVSFTELLLDLQLTRAKLLLRDTDETLEEIAEHCGFRSGKSFSRQFKERENMTPYRYRRNMRPHPDSGSGGGASARTG